MLRRGTFFLFSLRGRVVAGLPHDRSVIIAVEPTRYIGPMDVGRKVIDDLSDLVVAGRQAQAIVDALERIGETLGTEIKREHGELFTLFDDPALTPTARPAPCSVARINARVSFARPTGTRAPFATS